MHCCEHCTGLKSASRGLAELEFVEPGAILLPDNPHQHGFASGLEPKKTD
jgi:hypothetical protein